MKTLKKLLSTFGINPYKFVSATIGLPGFVIDYIVFRKAISKLRSQKEYTGNISLYPCLTDKGSQGGTCSGHYFWQDLIVAQKLCKASPKYHLDIGSRVDGFVAHVASFRRLDVLDIRPTVVNVPNVKFILGDISDSSCLTNLKKYDSVSCLHALEHVGLGRYGDKLDPLGYFKAAQNITNILAIDGILYLSVPIGTKSSIEFNAHRIFKFYDIIMIFQNLGLVLIDYSYVNDLGDYNALPNLEDQKPLSVDTFVYDGEYGCGIFEFKKIDLQP